MEFEEGCSGRAGNTSRARPQFMIRLAPRACAFRPAQDVLESNGHTRKSDQPAVHELCWRRIERKQRAGAVKSVLRAAGAVGTNKHGAGAQAAGDSESVCVATLTVRLHRIPPPEGCTGGAVREAFAAGPVQMDDHHEVAKHYASESLQLQIQKLSGGNRG